jgi:outer membrane murein-binding lipoprotein Lpp
MTPPSDLESLSSIEKHAPVAALSARNDGLTGRVEQLEARVAALEAENEAIRAENAALRETAAARCRRMARSRPCAVTVEVILPTGLSKSGGT